MKKRDGEQILLDAFRRRIQMWEVGLELVSHFSEGREEIHGGDDPEPSPLRWPHRFHVLIPAGHQQSKLWAVFPAAF